MDNCKKKGSTEAHLELELSILVKKIFNSYLVTQSLKQLNVFFRKKIQFAAQY